MTPTDMAISSIALTHIRFSMRQSRETFAFTGRLVVNGAIIIPISNDGHGGAHRFDIDADTLAALESWAAALPAHQHEGMTLPMTLDLWVSLQLEGIEYQQRTRRMCSRATYFRFLTDPPHQWRKVGQRFGPAVRAQLAARFKNQYLEFLNDQVGAHNQ